MKWVAMIMSFIMGNMQKHSLGIKDSAMEIFDEVVYKSRSAVMLTLGAFAAIIILCGGLFMAIIQATTQYDMTGQIFFSSTIAVGLILAALSLIVCAVVFTRAWPGVRTHLPKPEVKVEAQGPQVGNSLEQAVALLVMDFVKEREASRLRRDQQAASRESEMRSARRQSPSDLKESSQNHH
jgi:hypothetical protein